MKLFLGCLVIFISTITAIDAIAPGDRSPICRTNFRYRLSHDWIPYANDTSSGTWKVLIDQYDYETLEGQFSIPPGVWSALDVDNDGLRLVQGGGGTCAYQIRVPNTYRTAGQNNWIFTQAIDYIDAVELIVNATVRFTGCSLRPDCATDYVILHRYDTNTLSETQRTNPGNYQPYLGNSQSSRLQQDQDNINDDTTIIARFRRPANFNYTYLGIQDIGSSGSIQRIFLYYEVCPGKLEGLVTYPEVPHPGELQGSLSRTTRLASCAENAHNITSLETYAYGDGRCEQSGITCACDAGYEEQSIQNRHQCIACKVGEYRSLLNSSCVVCPANSTSKEAAEHCTCTEGHYRTMTYERIGVQCTAPPPPISECLVSAIFDTGVTIQWRNPPHCGGRNDCYYQIKINDDPSVQYIPSTFPDFSTYTVENLQPDTIYSITISIHNGVSDQDAENAKLRECSIVVKTIRGNVFILGGITYPNNTAIILEHIGEGDMNSLTCTTAHDRCCQTPGQGNFYYPSGDAVLTLSQASLSRQSLYRTRSTGSISLRQQAGEISPPLGRYRCEIPDSRGALQNLYITIGTIRELSTECPTIPDCPTQQPVTCPPEATTPETIPDIHFELSGVILTNNSVVNVNDIGEGGSALLCKTNLLNCCGTPPNRFGEFFYPSGDQVPIRARGEGFYRNRRQQSVRLNRRDGITAPTGKFRCEIPDATRVMKSVYITIN